MRSLVVEVAGPRLESENRERWLERAAGIVGVSYRAAKAVYYDELDPNCSVVKKFKAAAAERDREQAGNIAHQFEELVAKFERHAPVLARSEIDAVLRVAGRLRSFSQG